MVHTSMVGAQQCARTEFRSFVNLSLVANPTPGMSSAGIVMRPVDHASLLTVFVFSLDLEGV